jgi:hypothetical protein
MICDVIDGTEVAMAFAANDPGRMLGTNAWASRENHDRGLSTKNDSVFKSWKDSATGANDTPPLTKVSDNVVEAPMLRWDVNE